MSSKKKTIITTTGFYNTGSSAITHMLSEFDVVSNTAGTYEIRIMFDPDAMSDLEYNLIDNPHRQNTPLALLRFKEYIDFNSSSLLNHHYEQMCDGNFKKISYEYLEDLCDFKYLGASHLDVWHRGKLFWIVNRIYKKIIYSVFGYTPPKYIVPSLMKPQVQYAGTFDEDNFLLASKKYLSKFLSYVNKDNRDILMIDQLLPPTNISRYQRYIPEDYSLKTIIVDRDPRDLYVICKYLENTKIIPCDTPEDFCRWFLWTRGQSAKQKDSNDFLRVQFEDLIYEYDKTRNKVVEFCGFENMQCSQKRNVFKPMNSINNTHVWLRYPQSKDEVVYIENRLKDYCYDYDSKDLKPDYEKGKMFEC